MCTCVFKYTVAYFLNPADHNLDISSLEYDVTTISSALKAFFKLLPSPLFPDDSTQAVLSIFGT